MTTTERNVNSLITQGGMEKITAKFVELTGAPASQACLRYMWDRATTQFAHRDYGLVQVGLGDWETKSGRAERVEFPLNFFVL